MRWNYLPKRKQKQQHSKDVPTLSYILLHALSCSLLIMLLHNHPPPKKKKKLTHESIHTLKKNGSTQLNTHTPAD